MLNNYRYSKQNIFHTAGWLFADLFLALTIIFIATSITGKPQVKAVPTPTFVPTPTPTSPSQALDPHPLDFSVIVNPFQLSQSDIIAHIKSQVNQYLDQAQDGSRKAGFVLTFAGGIDGVNHAASFNVILQSMPPFQGAVLKNYHDLAHFDDEFDVEVYFFV